MIMRIGITAGSILEFLDDCEEIELSELIVEVGESRDNILMGLGWLVRQGLVFIKKNEQNKVLVRSLRKVAATV